MSVENEESYRPSKATDATTEAVPPPMSYPQLFGVVRRNPRNFRQPSSSPATSASRSMNLPSVWKV